MGSQIMLSKKSRMMMPVARRKMVEYVLGER